jgi:hypothetical protein
MTQDKLDLLKSQLPISFEVTMSMDYPNGIKDNSLASAKIAGTISQYGIILTWYYLSDPDNIIVEYCGYNDGEEVKIPILQLREFLLKLKG